MQTQPTADEYRENYAEPVDPPDHVDPYAVNLAGLVAFNPAYVELRKTFGPTIEVDEPIMLGGPQVSFSPAARPDEWPNEHPASEAVVIKLAVSGQDRVTNRGRDVTDRQAAELLGISEDVFARGHELAAAGLEQGVAAMDSPNRSPEPSAAGGPNLGIGPPR